MASLEHAIRGILCLIIININTLYLIEDRQLFKP